MNKTIEQFEKELSKANAELYPDRPGSLGGLHNQSSCLNYALSMAAFRKKQSESERGK